MKAFRIIATVSAGVALAVSLGARAQGLEPAWETAAELKNPESALYDSQNRVIYVSNVDGAPNEKDGKGSIAKLSPDGEIEDVAWVEGLDAPKGLALYDGKLYVSDIDTLVEIDIAGGEIANRYRAADAQFLNDVTVDDDGLVYVSDMVTNTVYRLQDGVLDAWLQDDALENPNGLLVEGDKLIVGSWGRMTDGFQTEVPGHLKSVALSDGAISTLGSGKPVGNLDGVESDNQGNYYVTDWMAGKLLHIKPNGDAETLLELGQGAADHEVIADQGLIVIPMMTENKVVAYHIPQ